MQRTFSGKITLLLFAFLTLSLTPAKGGVSIAVLADMGLPVRPLEDIPPEQREPNGTWVDAVQASANPITLPAEPDGSSEPMAILGGIVAGIFFFGLLALHLRMRRQNELLLRSGDRDVFLMPPARNRRRRPR